MKVLLAEVEVVSEIKLLLNLVGKPLQKCSDLISQSNALYRLGYLDVEKVFRDHQAVLIHGFLIEALNNIEHAILDHCGDVLFRLGCADNPPASSSTNAHARYILEVVARVSNRLFACDSSADSIGQSTSLKLSCLCLP